MRPLSAARLSRARARGVLGGIVGAAALAACAQPGAPPGGPPDPTPPALVRITPESGAVNVRPPELLFRFDEVIGERPQGGGTTMDQLVLVSPRDGAPEVRWRRSGLGVRPREGWRPNTTYVVQLLPGVADLRGNRRDSATTVVFSTGPTIVPTRITGVVFDWPRGTAATDALVQAVVRPDTSLRDSVVYVVRADSSGRFVLPHVPAGQVTVRGGVDANRNFGLDGRELRDEAVITLRDSAQVELYAFVRDTIGPQIANVVVQDSVTLQLTLNQPLALDQPLDTALVQLFDADSAPVALAAVLSRRAVDSLAAARRDSAAVADSAAPADTLARRVPAPAPPARPAPAPTDTAAAAARPPGQSPAPRRPTPTTELVIRTARPLAPSGRYRLVVRGARNLLGAAATSERVFTAPAPPPAAPPAGEAGRPPR